MTDCNGLLKQLSQAQREYEQQCAGSIEQRLQTGMENMPKGLELEDIRRYILSLVNNEQFRPLTDSQRKFKEMVKYSNACVHSHVTGRRGLTRSQIQQIVKECSQKTKGMRMPREVRKVYLPDDRYELVRQSIISAVKDSADKDYRHAVIRTMWDVTKEHEM